MLKFIFDTLWTCGARPPFASIVCCGLIGCRMRRATSVKRGARGAIMGGVSFAFL